jgi:phenylalanyl-tRNA synthetase beta chain
MEEPSWMREDQPVSFFHLKGYCLNFLKKLGIDLQQFDATDLSSVDDIFTGGLEYQIKKKPVLRMGKIQPGLLNQFDIEQDVYFAEMYWEPLCELTSVKRQFSGLPKFPEVRRDLALLLDTRIQYARIEELAAKSAGEVLTRMELFDYYKGKNIPEGKKSYAVSFYLQDRNKTLTDKEIDSIMNKITQSVVKNLGAELR